MKAMATGRLFCGSKVYFPWKKLCRVIFATAMLGTALLMAFHTFFRRPNKLQLSDSNLGKIQAEILVKNSLGGVVNTSVHNSKGNQKIFKGAMNTSVHNSAGNNNILKEASNILQSHSLCPADEVMKSPKVTKLGRYPETKRYLSIGIASVARPSGANYLPQTIESLIDNLSDMDKKDTYIVIFLADLQDPPKSTAKEELSNSFGKYIEEGLLTVTEAYPEFYPPLTNIKKKYGDSDSRRKWRSKENVDAAFVMCYCKELSQYYIHLEDDVISSLSLFPKLQDFISAQNVKPWMMLDATQKGSKAKVFHSQDLKNLASYFYLMYDEMPIDWLMDHWRKIKTKRPHDEKEYARLPPASLFQHIGDRSSLEEKGMSGKRQKEPFFDQYDQKYKGLNPPAIVTSSMSPHQGEPQDAYDKGSSYFWAKKPRKDDYVLIKFNTPTAVKEVFVDTGCYQAEDDLLQSGKLQASFESVERNPNNKNNNSCGNFQTFGSFIDGKAKVSLDESKKVNCLRILVNRGKKELIYFREIDVW